jgi:formylglycine-generating enzyme required for sulfatase activity
LDALDYTEWLSAQTGQSYRLPTEAEWEYAARAGTETAFWWGDDISPAQANYDGNYTYRNGPKGAYRNQTVPVDHFQPNPWGLYQVHGNVREWTGSQYDENYNGAETQPFNRNTCGPMVVRNGGWPAQPAWVRSASRFGDDPTKRYLNRGFRFARSL